MRRIPLPKTTFFNTVRARLILLVLLVFIPALGLQVYDALSDLQVNVEQQKQASVQLIKHAQSDFGNLIETSRAVFASLAGVNELNNSNTCNQVITAMQLAYEQLAPVVVNIGLADGQGNIRCSIKPTQGKGSIGEQIDFQTVVQTFELAVGEYQDDPAVDKPSLSISSPVLSEQGEVQSVLFLTIDTTWLENWLKDSALPPNSSITLFSPGGEGLWRTLNGEDVPIDGSNNQPATWYRQLQNGDQATIEGQDFDGVSRLHTLQPLKINAQTAGWLHLGYPISQLYDEAYTLLGWKMGVIAALALVVLLLAWWASEALFLRPLSNLMEVVKRVQGGDLGVRVSGLKGLGEVNELANSFDQMTDALQRRENERRQMEERFTAAFKSSAIGMGMMGLDGRILAVNAAVCKMSGYSEEELKWSYNHDHVYPPDLEVGEDLFAEMLEGKRGYYSVEKRYVRKNGEVFWTRLTLSLVRDRLGDPAYLVAMIEDIDQDKQKSAALADSEARFEAIYENAAIGISLIAPDGEILAVNPTLIEMSGRSEAELKALRGQGITYSEDLDVGRREFYEVVNGTRQAYSVEKRYVHRDGRIHWMRQTVSAARDIEGKLLYLVVVAEDIDRHKRAVEELRESEARFRAILDNTAVGIAVMTLDRHIVQINQTVTRLTGYTSEEIAQINPSMLAIEEDRLIDRDLFVELVEGKRNQYLAEKRYIRKDGSIFWGRVNFALVRGPDNQSLYTIGMIEDITEEKQAAGRLAAQEAEYRRTLEEKIAERTEELNLANEQLREKVALDAVIAERTRLARDLHDAVTQTLFSTTLIADVLPDIWEMNQAEGRRRLEELRLLTRGALAEMRTLLVELRPNALVEVPLPTLLRQLVDALIGRARINIQLSAEDSPGGDSGSGHKLPADVQVGLYRIAQEALNNVVKHARASEAAITLRTGDVVRLTVADNGKGFDPAQVTADHLGLKIMRERAETIGAKISIYSEPGEGTQITIIWQGKEEAQ